MSLAMFCGFARLPVLTSTPRIVATQCVKYLSSTPLRRSSRLDNAVMLQADQFASLTLQTARTVDIRPLDNSQDCPDIGIHQMLCTAVVEEAGSDKPTLTSETKGNDLYIDIDGTTTSNEPITIWLPFTMGVTVQSKETGSHTPSISIKSMEGKVYVNTSKANVSLKSCKGGVAEVHTNGGDITADSIQGDVKFVTDSGKINIKKIQALDLQLSAASGDIFARALYSKKIFVQSDSGSIILGSVHGQTNIVSSTGTVFVGTVEGAIDIEAPASKEVDVHLVDFTDASIISETGHIRTTFQDDASCSFNISSPEVSLGEISTSEVKDKDNLMTGIVGSSKGDSLPKLTLTSTKGAVSLSQKSWFEASMTLTERLAGM